MNPEDYFVASGGLNIKTHLIEKEHKEVVGWYGDSYFVQSSLCGVLRKHINRDIPIFTSRLHLTCKSCIKFIENQNLDVDDFATPFPTYEVKKNKSQWKITTEEGLICTTPTKMMGQIIVKAMKLLDEYS